MKSENYFENIIETKNSSFLKRNTVFIKKNIYRKYHKYHAKNTKISDISDIKFFKKFLPSLSDSAQWMMQQQFTHLERDKDE